MASNRLTWILAFGVLWMIVMFVMHSTFTPHGDSSEVVELNRQLRDALEKLKSVKTANDKLTRDIQTIRQKVQDNVDDEAISVNQDADKFKKQLESANLDKTKCLEQIENLQISNKHLQESLDNKGHDYISGGKHGVIDIPGEGPSLEHELARFKLINNIQELYYFTKSQLQKVKTDQSRKMLEDVGHRHRSIMVDIINLSHTDNAEEWRMREHEELQSLMQRRLYHLQNPKDCSTAKKLVCDLNKGCGFGCQLHHAVYCFMIAYGTERTLILKSQGWRYSSGGWETVFKPVSETCKSVSPGQSTSNWRGENESKNSDVVVLPIVDSLSKRPPYMPLSFPEDLAPRLQRLTDDPAVWFISQFVKYLMRPQPSLQQDIDKVKEQLKFINPIVGIHVRRTDKVGTEAAFHGIEEYMEHVDEWFKLQERIPNKIDKRRVYLASDDPGVLPEAIKKYPGYQFFGDTDIAKTAGVAHRYTDSSLRGVILDIYFLAQSDYLVCTFSSQVCRVAYEIMQTLHPDASRWFHSLDDIYYFGGQGGHQEKVLYEHKPENRDEIALEPGDIVGIAGNHWDGYSKGRNTRTGGIGLYPSYKTEDKKVIVKYPTYPEVPDKET